MLNVSAFGGDYNEQFFAGIGIEVMEKWLTKNRDKCPPVPKNARIASCVARPSKIVAIGLNLNQIQPSVTLEFDKVGKRWTSRYCSLQTLSS